VGIPQVFGALLFVLKLGVDRNTLSNNVFLGKRLWEILGVRVLMPGKSKTSVAMLDEVLQGQS
jgi:hypothetical protein